MLVAIDNLDATIGKLIRATKNAVGYCRDCKTQLIPKCGMIVTHHWAHHPDTNCHCWEPESKWHLDWKCTLKNPKGNIEVKVVTEEKYKRADMVTAGGMIIEFQKSPMSLEERLDREEHYRSMLWVIHPDIANSKTWRRRTGCAIVIDNVSTVTMTIRGTDLTFFKKDFIKLVVNGNTISRTITKDLVDKYLKATTVAVDPYTIDTIYYHDRAVQKSINWEAMEQERMQRILAEQEEQERFDAEIKEQRKRYAEENKKLEDERKRTLEAYNARLEKRERELQTTDKACTTHNCKYNNQLFCTSPATVL